MADTTDTPTIAPPTEVDRHDIQTPSLMPKPKTKIIQPVTELESGWSHSIEERDRPQHGTVRKETFEHTGGGGRREYEILTATKDPDLLVITSRHRDTTLYVPLEPLSIGRNDTAGTAGTIEIGRNEEGNRSIEIYPDYFDIERTSTQYSVPPEWKINHSDPKRRDTKVRITVNPPSSALTSLRDPSTLAMGDEDEGTLESGLPSSFHKFKYDVPQQMITVLGNLEAVKRSEHGDKGRFTCTNVSVDLSKMQPFYPGQSREYSSDGYIVYQWNKLGSEFPKTEWTLRFDKDFVDPSLPSLSDQGMKTGVSQQVYQSPTVEDA